MSQASRREVIAVNIPVNESKVLLNVELASLNATFRAISQNGIKNMKIYTLKAAEEITFKLVSKEELFFEVSIKEFSFPLILVELFTCITIK